MLILRHLAGAQWLCTLLFVMLALGLLLVLYAAWRYFSIGQELQGNLAQAIHSGQLNADPQSSTEAVGLVGADMTHRALLAQQFHALMAGGAGLVLLSLGWLGFILARALGNPRPTPIASGETPS